MNGECVLSGLCLFETFFGLFFCGEARVVLKCPIIASCGEITDTKVFVRFGGYLADCL